MIIWGTRGRQTEIASGLFNCPKCEIVMPFKHYRSAKYFTLFFIPLFQLENFGEYVECQHCSQTYKPEVLTYQPPSDTEKIMQAIRGQLVGGLPIHMVGLKLIADGLDEETAIKVVGIATGGNLAKCPNCSFCYIDSVKLCANCGTILVK